MSVNKNRVAERLVRKRFALDFLGGKCANCHVTEDLEFDHIKQDRADNKHCISVMISDGASMARLIDELRKCQLLCKPCHWEKTKKDLGQGVYTHGTTTCYRKLACRCTECRVANSTYLLEYRKKRKQKVS